MPRPRTLSQLGLRLLVVLNATMALIAFTYDWQAMASIPPWALPFIVICPLYPALLALIWLTKLRRRIVSDWILAFALLPAATYGVLAPLFYTTHLYVTVFSWNNIGQIFWVWIYAAQAIWLLVQKPLSQTPALLGTSFVILSLSLQLATKSYGYLAISDIPTRLQLLLFIFGCVIALGWYTVTQENWRRNALNR